MVRSYLLWLAAVGLLTGSASAQPAAVMLPRPGGVIAYEDWGGTGQLVIAAPGMGDVRAEYRLLAPRLRDAGYHVVVLDVRGFGQSSAQWDEYAAHAVGGDMLALADHLHAGRAVMLGTSFAAGAAIWAAHDAPDKVAGVVLISPVLRDQQQSVVARAALWLAFAGPWRVKAWLSYWDSLFPLHKPADHAAIRAALGANMRERGRMEALRAMVTLSKADTAAILRQTHVPALLIMGTADPDFPDPPAEARYLSGALGSQVLLVEGAGHYPQVELPDPVAARVVAFLQALR